MLITSAARQIHRVTTKEAMTEPFLTRLISRPAPRGLIVTVSLLSLISASATVVDYQLTSGSLQAALSEASAGSVQVSTEDMITGDSLALTGFNRSLSDGVLRPVQASASLLTRFRSAPGRVSRGESATFGPQLPPSAFSQRSNVPPRKALRHLPRALAMGIRALSEAVELASLGNRPGQLRLLQAVVPRPEPSRFKSKSRSGKPARVEGKRKSSRSTPRRRAASAEPVYSYPVSDSGGYVAGTVYHF